MLRLVSKIFLGVLIIVVSCFAADSSNPNHSVRFETLYNFTGGPDGCCILGGLARESDGTLYGVAYGSNFDQGYGTLFKLTPRQQRQGYRFQVLHDFSPGSGTNCETTPTPAGGNVFGVCTDVGSGNVAGTLWEYSNAGDFIVLHNFTYQTDGYSPQDSVALDKNGNIYGTALGGGPGNAGTLWEYSLRSGVFKVLHAFSNGDDGGDLYAGPRMDQHGVLWGTTMYGPNCYDCGAGTLWSFDLTSGIFTTVLDFTDTAILAPLTRLAIDNDGNLFGTAYGAAGGGANCGVVYELPKENNYTPLVLYAFTGENGDGCYPFGRVRFDKHGNLLGTTYQGGDDGGTVYALKRESGEWKEIILHSFDVSDGWRPQSGLVSDKEGRWFGTTAYGGPYNAGTVFEISGVP